MAHAGLRRSRFSTLIAGFTGDADLGRVLRAAGATFAIRTTGAAVAYVSLIALARWMGAAEYGAFAFAASWAYLLALPAGLGLPLASVRFLPEYSSTDAWSRVRGFIGRSLWLTLAVSATIGLVAAAVVFLAGDRVPPAYRIPLVIVFLGLPAFTLMVLGAQIGRAFGWVVAAYSPLQVWHPLFLLVSAGLIVLAGFTLTARAALLASVTVSIACLLAQFLVYARRLRPRLKGMPPEYEQRKWLRVAAPLLLIEGFNSLMSYSDIVMLGIFLTPSAVAYYFAATRTAALVTFFFTSVTALTAPRIAELHAMGRRDEVQALLRGIAPWIALPATAVTLVLIAGGGILLPLFGEGFEVGWLALTFLALGNLVLSVNGPASMLLNMTGHQDTTAKAYGAAAAANIALNIILIPRFGLAGAALATMVSTAAMSCWLVWIASRTLGIRTAVYLGRT